MIEERSSIVGNTAAWVPLFTNRLPVIWRTGVHYLAAQHR